MLTKLTEVVITVNIIPAKHQHVSIFMEPFIQSLKKLRPDFSQCMNGGSYIPCGPDCVNVVLCLMLCADLRFLSFATIGCVLFILDFKLCARRDTK